MTKTGNAKLRLKAEEYTQYLSENRLNDALRVNNELYEMEYSDFVHWTKMKRQYANQKINPTDKDGLEGHRADMRLANDQIEIINISLESLANSAQMLLWKGAKSK